MLEGQLGFRLSPVSRPVSFIQQAAPFPFVGRLHYIDLTVNRQVGPCVHTESQIFLTKVPQ